MDTSFLTSDALAVKKWSAAVFLDQLAQLKLGKFVGKTPKSMIMTVSDLLKSVGDQITFPLVYQLSGAGKKDDEWIEDSEEALVAKSYAVQLHLRKNAWRAAGEMTLRMVAFDLKQQAKNELAKWHAKKDDEDVLLALSGVANSDLGLTAVAPSTNRKWKGGQTVAGVLEAVATDALVDSVTLNLFGEKVISAVKRKAQLATPIIQPIATEDGEYYLMFIHPYQAKALKSCTDWINDQRYANVRGMKNPIFSGALGIYDGVIIHEYNDIETRLGDGVGTSPATYFESGDPFANGIYGARALFCGAQAAVKAYGAYPNWNEKMFEYGSVPGVMSRVIRGIGKTRFALKGSGTEEDYAVITVDTAYVPD